MKNSPEITQVRTEHQIDEAKLQTYLTDHLDNFSGDLIVRQFEGGQSNPTYLLESNGRRWVMRKKPPGDLLKSAHAVDREYRVMKALQNTDIPVPRMDLLCEDDSIMGTPFFVMEWVEGRIILSSVESGIEPSDVREIYLNYISNLAKLHAVDYKAIGLEDYGRPGNYFSRQINRWSSQYKASETGTFPEMDKLMEWLPENIPEDDSTSIVHGDYTVRNMVVHSTEPRVLAILDWELSTIGHPLGDLAYACQFFHHSELSRDELHAFGIPREQELIDLYCKISGRPPVSNWAFYIAFCKFRLAAICQGVYKRGLDGNASSATALEQRPVFENSACAGWAVVEASLTK